MKMSIWKIFSDIEGLIMFHVQSTDWYSILKLICFLAHAINQENDFNTVYFLWQRWIYSKWSNTRSMCAIFQCFENEFAQFCDIVYLICPWYKIIHWNKAVLSISTYFRLTTLLQSVFRYLVLIVTKNVWYCVFGNILLCS